MKIWVVCLTVLILSVFASCTKSGKSEDDVTTPPSRIIKNEKPKPKPVDPAGKILKSKMYYTLSGLKYEILKKGSGKFPFSNDTVVCHYKGTLLNGKVFDSSYKRKKPLVFKLNQVIKGWGEMILLMQVGTKVRVIIPYFLAYGKNGHPPAIPPKSDLVFVIELMEIK
jgi:FKBP-type peptidyl-prolyl cis-trans isomerase